MMAPNVEDSDVFIFKMQHFMAAMHGFSFIFLTLHRD